MSGPSDSIRDAGVLAKVRAGALSVVLAVSVLKAAPSRPLRPEQLPAGALTALLVRVSKELTTARSTLLKPFGVLDDALGMGQSWALFPVRDVHAFRIRVDVMHRDQRWYTVYRAHERDELGLTSRLAYRRLRAIYDPRSKTEARDEYEPFVQWLANELLAKREAWVGVRVAMERLKLGTPSAPTRFLSTEHVFEVYRPGTP